MLAAMDALPLIDGQARAEVVPARGAIVTRFDVAGTPLLYLDPATLADPSKNVRGGVPFLFPTAGRLAGDRYGEREMKQHGFARNLPFAVERHEPGAAFLTLGASDETRAGNELKIAQRYRNLGREPMPLHVGFHPYFFVPDADKARTSVSTQATRAFDNVQKREVELRGFDFTEPEVDLHLHDHGSTRSQLRRPGAPAVEIEASPEFKTWVIWTLAQKDFVCVEPWTAPGNALNSGEGLLWVEPEGARELWIAIRSL
jgi:galactose mutarotase-like enzyme